MVSHHNFAYSSSLKLQGIVSSIVISSLINLLTNFLQFFMTRQGMFSGLFFSLACVLLLIAQGGLAPSFRATFPSIVKLLGGAVFPICLILHLVVGGDLFTGNILYMTMAFIHGKASVRMCADVLIFSFFTNLGWMLFFDYFLALKTDLFLKEPYLSQVYANGAAHVGQSFGTVVLKGIGANTLVCIGVFIGTIARSALSKIVLIWMPVAAFVTIGYDHVVANMGYVPIAIMYGAPITIDRYIIESIIPSVIGNFVGAGFLLGATLVYVYAWESRSWSTLKELFDYNFVPTTTLKEEWTHYTTKIWYNIDQSATLVAVELYHDEDVEGKMDH
jgi:formate/nitrite transporter